MPTSGPSIDEISERTLAAIEKEIVARHDVEKSHVTGLRILPSPIRRLPPEILLEIFVLLSETIEVPLRLTETPWILGHVCSQWRTISRAEPRLWEPLTIDLNANPVTFEENISCIEDLECAIDILPPVVNIDLFFSEEYTDPEEVYPYLNRCRLIGVYGNIEFVNDICQNAPHNAFQNLAIVHFVIYPSDEDGSENSQGFASGPGSTRGQLHFATHFEQLKLEMGEVGEQAITSLVSLDIPHGQLKVLNISVNVDIPALCKFLEQCYSVTDLSVQLGKSYIPSREHDNYLYLPELRKLHIFGTNLASWIPTLCGNWQNLRSFHLSGGMCSAERLQEILTQCASLEFLRLVVPPNFPLRPLSMPILRFMEANYQDSAGSFTHFFVPALEYLRITLVGDHDFDMNTLSDMFEHSRCPLSEFQFNDYRRPIRTTPFPHKIFTPISRTLDTVFLSGSDLDPAILREIGSGRLLPKVKDFTCHTESGSAILDMIEARLLQETSDDGKERTWRFCFNTSVPFVSPEANSLKHYGSSHGVHVTITPWSWDVTNGPMDERLTAGVGRLRMQFLEELSDDLPPSLVSLEVD